jgi:predicted RNA binding protein YcfA (HicA-like mRNA interferase family)
MKRRDLEQKLKELGWYPVPSKFSGPHEKWTNGRFTLPIPRHRELKEWTARGIIKDAIRFNIAKAEDEKT